MNKLLKSIMAGDDADWLTGRVDTHLESDGAGRTDAGWLHPSALASPCDMDLALQYLGYPARRVISARLQRIFDLGTSRDRDWKGYLGEAGLSAFLTTYVAPETCGRCGAEYPPARHICIPEWHIRGELDDIVINPATGERSVVEIKTKNTALFTALKAPDPPHLIQINLYMYATAIPRGIVLYENKNDQNVRVFPVRYDPALAEAVHARIQRVLDALDRGFEPERGCLSQPCEFWGWCSVSMAVRRPYAPGMGAEE